MLSKSPVPIMDMSEIEKSFEQLFLISKFLLIFPLKQDKNGFHRSALLTSCCVAHIIFLFYGAIHTLNMRPINTVGMYLAEFVLRIQVLTMVISVFLSVICYSQSINRLNVMIRNLKDIDAVLYNFVAIPDTRETFKCTCFFGISSLVIMILDVLWFQDEIFATVILYWIFFLTLNMMYHFAGLMDIFLVRFKVLNQRVDGLMHLKLPPLGVLIRLTRIWGRLLDCVLIANRIYSIQLLSYFFSYFVALTSIVGYFLNLKGSDVYKLLGMAFVLCYWVFFLLFNFYSVLSRTHNVTIEVKEFNCRLYEVMLCDETGLLLNDKILQLQISSKRNVTFTAAGFFNLDLTLLVGMAGGVTTYGVLLTQVSQRKTD